MSSRFQACWKTVLTTVLSASIAATLAAVEYQDDFADGIDPEHWTVVSNDHGFTCDDTGGDVFISHPEDGLGWGDGGYMQLCYAYDLVGDFDVSIDFFDATLECRDRGWNGVGLLVGFGHQFIGLGRNTEEVGGHVVGVWADPPAVWYSMPETATSGRLRVSRVGSMVTAYFDETVVHQQWSNLEQVTNLCVNVEHSHSIDSVSAHLDDFSLVADKTAPGRQIARIEASDGVGGDEFGAPIALNGDTLVIAAQEADYEFFPPNRPVSGAVYIFDRDSENPSGWSEVAKISQPEGEIVDEFGNSLAIHGTTLVVASWRACTERSLPEWICEAGAVYLFEQDQGGPGNWGFVKRFIAEGTWDADRFGSSVSIDGDLLVVGSSRFPSTGGHAGPGRAFVFQRNQGGPGNWGQVADLVGSDTEDGDAFGTAVSISRNSVIVGATRTDDACPGEFQCWSGSAYVFERDYGGPNNWGQVKRLSPDDLVLRDCFGATAVIDGNTAIVEQRNHGRSYGAAYVFQRDYGGVDNWGLVAKSKQTSNIGSPLDFRGDVALVAETGAAVILARNRGGENAWGEVARLSRRTGWAEGGFPTSLAVDDDFFVVGATSAVKEVDGIWRGENVGAVYIFELSQSEPPPVLRIRRSAGRRLRP